MIEPEARGVGGGGEREEGEEKDGERKRGRGGGRGGGERDRESLRAWCKGCDPLGETLLQELLEQVEVS